MHRLAVRGVIAHRHALLCAPSSDTRLKLITAALLAQEDPGGCLWPSQHRNLQTYRLVLDPVIMLEVLDHADPYFSLRRAKCFYPRREKHTDINADIPQSMNRIHSWSAPS